MHQAGCLCGAVRMSSRVEPRRVGICHCLDCRKWSGNVFATFAIFAVDDVTVTGSTGHFKQRHHCVACGSAVFSRWDDEIEIAVGCFDAPNEVVPTYELWMKRRESWLPPFGLEEHDGNRP